MIEMVVLGVFLGLTVVVILACSGFCAMGAAFCVYNVCLMCVGGQEEEEEMLAPEEEEEEEETKKDL